jgi:hypothetical protein
MKEIFEKIYQKNTWGSTESVSGTGSTLRSTKNVRNFLPELLNDLKTLTLLDIPCGDWNWMKEVNLKNINYIGADIVPDIIEKNKSLHSSDNISFYVLDITKSELPNADTALVRDCLFHFSFDDTVSALKNLKASGIKYLISTTFPTCTENTNIKTGGYRKINLSIYPYNLGDPLILFKEKTGNTNYSKSLGVWDLTQIEI